MLIDHTWVWRADHGVEGFTEGVNGDTDRWRTNTGRNGAVINGDDVIATGLFVEHFQQYNTIWNGENGTHGALPERAAVRPAHPGGLDERRRSLGWAGYKVGDDVRNHKLYGGGVYVFNQNNPAIHTANGFEVPDRPGVQLHHIMTVNLSAGIIDHVVNGVGAAADTTKVGVPVFVEQFPNSLDGRYGDRRARRTVRGRRRQPDDVPRDPLARRDLEVRGPVGGQRRPHHHDQRPVDGAQQGDGVTRACARCGDSDVGRVAGGHRRLERRHEDDAPALAGHAARAQAVDARCGRGPASAGRPHLSASLVAVPTGRQRSGPRTWSTTSRPAIGEPSAARTTPLMASVPPGPTSWAGAVTETLAGTTGATVSRVTARACAGVASSRTAYVVAVSRASIVNVTWPSASSRPRPAASRRCGPWRKSRTTSPGRPPVVVTAIVSSADVAATVGTRTTRQTSLRTRGAPRSRYLAVAAAGGVVNDTAPEASAVASATGSQRSGAAHLEVDGLTGDRASRPRR